MREYFTAFQMTQSMFCSLPFPCKKWDEKCRPYMMAFLPLIGLEIGLLWVLLEWILRRFSVSNLIYGFLMCAVPYVVTGFIHLDGFMDVVDAVGSWRDLEKRRAILKDSHVGSFAVIWCFFLILCGFTMFASIANGVSQWILLFVPIVSRCCSALAVILMKTMSTSQYANAVCYPKWHKGFLIFLILASVTTSFILFKKYGVVLLAELLGYGAALKKSYTSLQGMNGDISGYCICISELCAVTAIAFI